MAGYNNYNRNNNNRRNGGYNGQRYSNMNNTDGKPKYDQTGAPFVNPYNFISVLQNPVELGGEKDSRKTGYLDCSMILKTPLCVPDSETVSFEKVTVDGKIKDHPHYKFFRIDGIHPVIPGSTIRGSARSTFEIVTGSCMSTLKKDTILTRRQGSREALKPGLLIRNNEGEWELYRAKKYLLPVNGSGYRRYKFCRPEFEAVKNGGERVLKSADGTTEFRNGSKVSFGIIHSADSDWCKKNGFPMWEGIAEQVKEDKNGTGYICIGELITNRKHGEGIFVRGKRIDNVDTETAMYRLDEVVENYQDASINRNLGADHCGYQSYDRCKRNGVIPVWYDEKSPSHLSLASIGRVAYDNTLNQLVGTQDSCANKKTKCPACRLFGMIGNEALGSRVRFGDAKLENPDVFKLEEEPLKELSSPKYSYMPFYGRKGITYTDSYDNNPAFSGRKYYWHQSKAAVDRSVYSTEEKTDRNASIELLMPSESKNRFQFRVYYDGITEMELNALIWALTLGDNQADSSLCNKIGHGKPLGLGSVKILVEQKCERSFSLEDGYQLVCTSPVSVAPLGNMEKKAIRELLEMANFHAMDKYKVSYPYVTESQEAKEEYKEAIASGKELKDKNILASHHWFGEYKEVQRTGPKGALPSPLASNLELKSLVLKEYGSKAFKETKKSDGGESYSNGRLIKGENPKIGEEFTATITGYDDARKKAFFFVNNVNRSIFFKSVPGARYGEIDKSLEKGKEYRFKYLGKDSNGFDSYEYLGKV